MISHQETLTLSPYMAIYDIVMPKDAGLFICKAGYMAVRKALAFQQTEEFSRLAKERYKVEAKNSKE